MNTFEKRIESHSLVGNMNMNTDIFFASNEDDLYSTNKSELEFFGIMDETNPFEDSMIEPFFPITQQKTNHYLTLENEQLKQKLSEYQKNEKENSPVVVKEESNEQEKLVEENKEIMEILDDIENPFPRYTVTESTVRPYPVFLIDYEGDANNLLVKAVPTPGYKFKIENHIAYYKSKDQYQIQKDGKKAIIFEVLQVNDIGKADGEPIQIDFSLYSVDGPQSNLLVTKRSPVITVFNHSQYLPAPDIVKLIPDYCLENRIENIEAFGPLFLRKNNILECQIIEEDGRQISLLTGKDIIRKRNCFHSFTFNSPLHDAGSVLVRCRYKNREFGVGKRLSFLPSPTLNQPNKNIMTPSDSFKDMYDNNVHYGTQNPHPTNDEYFEMNYYSYQGEYEALRYSLMMESSKVILNKQDKHGMTCLHWAVLGENAKCVSLLLEKGASPNIISHFSETPLHIACRLGLSDIVTLLVEYDGKVDIQTFKNISVLHYSAFSGNCSIIKYLLDNEALELISDYDHDMLTPLHYAVFKGNYKVVNLLLSIADNIGEDLMIGDANGMTPLHWAVALGEIECIREFLSVCDERQINLKDTSGRTALFYSVIYPNVEICRELLSHKADPNAQDTLKETPLFSAVSINNGIIVSLLLENGADPNILNVNNEKPFNNSIDQYSPTQNPYDTSEDINNINLNEKVEDKSNATEGDMTEFSNLPAKDLASIFEEFKLYGVSKKSGVKNTDPQSTENIFSMISSIPKQLKDVETENNSLKSTIKSLEGKVKDLEEIITELRAKSN